MYRLFSTALLASVLAPAQNVEDAKELLRKVQSTAESTENWRAEVVERSQISGGGMHLQGEVRTKIAAQAPHSRRSHGRRPQDRVSRPTNTINTAHLSTPSPTARWDASAPV